MWLTETAGHWCLHGQGTPEDAELMPSWWTTVNSKVSWLLGLKTDVLADVLFVLYCWVSPQIHSGGDEKRVAACMCVGGCLSGTSATIGLWWRTVCQRESSLNWAQSCSTGPETWLKICMKSNAYSSSSSPERGGAAGVKSNAYHSGVTLSTKVNTLTLGGGGLVSYRRQVLMQQMTVIPVPAKTRTTFQFFLF